MVRPEADNSEHPHYCLVFVVCIADTVGTVADIDMTDTVDTAADIGEAVASESEIFVHSHFGLCHCLSTSSHVWWHLLMSSGSAQFQNCLVWKRKLWLSAHVMVENVPENLVGFALEQPELDLAAVWLTSPRSVVVFVVTPGVGLVFGVEEAVGFAMVVGAAIEVGVLVGS